ncbi:hypothetical protein JXA34_00005 [Patescibacteria group bacterium]|nr:hypothetical protein [Patescibacteria group bacterium]
MPNMLDAILRSIIQSLGIIESETVQLKALIGTPHDVEAIKIDTLRKFWETSSTTDWFSLEISNPTIKIENKEEFKIGSITVILHLENGKWNVEYVISDFEQEDKEGEYKVRWSCVFTIFLKLLEYIHLIHWIIEILLGSNH